MEDKSLNIFASTLKNHGYSVTKTRLVIFKLLKNKEPMSIQEILKVGSKQFDRASLYRTMKTFEELGVVHRINIGWKYKLELSDIFSIHHHHLTCLNCGQVIAIKEQGELEKLINQLALSHSFRPASHQIEIQGYCQNCALANS